MARYYPGNGQPATTASSRTVVAVEAENESMGGSSATPGDGLTIIVAAVERGTLYVVNSGRHRAYIWRNGELVTLEVDPPASSEIRHTHYELARKDRVLLCTEGFHQNVPTETIAHILKTEPEPDRAITALLDAAAKSRPADTAADVSVAVLDYKPLLRGVALPIAITATIFTAVVLAVIVLLIGNRFSFVGNTQALASSVVSATPVQSPSHTPAATQVPIAGPDVVTATATVRPQPTNTDTPTLEPTPTGTETPTSTPVPPTSVPPTGTPVPPADVLPTETPVPPAAEPPTETPVPPAAEPPTETPVPPTPVPPTDTPIPPTAEIPTETPTSQTPVPPTDAPVP
ncbi:MAG: hypothetical protein M1546_11760 [Chloroflexi bacterium]|nr:hypothetical protein [Chloroflexota bacterium]